MKRVRTSTGAPAWLATRHADVRMVLSDARFGKAPIARSATRRGKLPPGLLFTTDPPEHTILRCELIAAMRAVPSSALRPFVYSLADRLLDAEPVDVVTGYAQPLAIGTILAWLGIPESDSEECARWSEIVLSVNRYTDAEVEAAQDQLMDRMAELVALKKVSPGDDLLSALAQCSSSAVELGATMLVTGYETMTAAIVNSVLTMLVHGNGFESWPTEPAPLRRMLDELLRFSPFGGTMRSRCALVDVTIGDVLISKGELVLAATGPANRDPERFVDPEQFCPDRTDNRHVSFGDGARFCVGAQLAMMELAVALERLAVRAPGLRLAVAAEEIQVRAGASEPRPEELPVLWS